MRLYSPVDLTGNVMMIEKLVPWLNDFIKNQGKSFDKNFT